MYTDINGIYWKCKSTVTIAGGLPTGLPNENFTPHNIDEVDNKVNNMYEEIDVTSLSAFGNYVYAYRVGDHVTLYARLDSGTSTIPGQTDLFKLNIPRNFERSTQFIVTFATYLGDSATEHNIDVSHDGYIRLNANDVTRDKRSGFCVTMKLS